MFSPPAWTTYPTVSYRRMFRFARIESYRRMAAARRNDRLAPCHSVRIAGLRQLDGRQRAELKLVLPFPITPDVKSLSARQFDFRSIVFSEAPEASQPNGALGVLKRLLPGNDPRRVIGFELRLHHSRSQCCCRADSTEPGPAGQTLNEIRWGWRVLDSGSSCHREIFSKSSWELVSSAVSFLAVVINDKKPTAANTTVANTRAATITPAAEIIRKLRHL